MVESKHRYARSPDQIEMNLPNYSAEWEGQSKEIHDQIANEEEYWQGEGERGQEKYESMERER
jgi:hypothetical protein